MPGPHLVLRQQDRVQYKVCLAIPNCVSLLQLYADGQASASKPINFSIVSSGHYN